MQLRHNGKANSNGCPAEQGLHGDAGPLVAGGGKRSVGCSAKRKLAAKRLYGTVQVFQRVGGLDQPVDAGIVAKDIHGKATGCDHDAASGNGATQGWNQRGGVYSRAKGGGILKKKKVVDLSKGAVARDSA